MMDMPDRRRVFRSKAASQFEAGALIGSIFATELISPSNEIWLVSPWVSDIEVLDNRDGGLSSLESDLPRAKVLMSEVLSKLIYAGSKVYVVIKDDSHNDYFVNRLSRQVEQTGGGDRLNIIVKNELHTKGVLTDKLFLAGSMNFTFRGVSLSDEQVVLETAPDMISQALVEFRQRYLTDAA